MKEIYVEYEPGEKFTRCGEYTSDNLDHFKDAGYMIQKHEVVVDFDDIQKEVIQKIVNYFNIKTQIVWTDRGAHLYFKRPNYFTKSNGVTALGIKVEYKHIKNTPNGITIKRNGVLRDIENHGIREEFPKIFVPNPKFLNMLGMSDGDGRNTALFNHRIELNRNNFENWKQIVIFINNTIFSTPMVDKELENLLRDVTIKADKDNEHLIAETIIKDKNVILYSGALWFYNGKEYVSDRNKLRRMVVSYCYGKKSWYIEEVIKQMEMLCQLADVDTCFGIKMNNGVIKNGIFIEYDYTEFTPYSIPIEYHEEAAPVKEVDEYLDMLTSGCHDYRKLILEMMASCLITNPDVKSALARFFVLIGDGANGKGTILKIIEKILGSNNISFLDIDQMNDEKHLFNMIGKLANLGDDVVDKPINETKMKHLKNIATADMVQVRQIYKESSHARITASMIFTSNHLIKSFEKGHAFKRRVLWLPMFTRIEKPNPRFLGTVTNEQALEYWMKLIIEAMERLYEQGTYTESEVVNNFNKKYHEENDNTLVWLEGMKPIDIEGKRSPEVYEEYKTWAEENGENVMTARQLKKSIKDVLKMEIKASKIQGKTVKVFKNI